MNVAKWMVSACVLGASLSGCEFRQDVRSDDARGKAASSIPSSAVVAGAPAAVAAPAPPAARPNRTYPFTVTLEKRPTAEQARTAGVVLASVFREAAETMGNSQIDYAVAMADLNDDGRDDLIVHIQDGQYCGQWGCPARAILATPTGFSRTAVQLGVCFNATVTVLPTVTNGMRDLEFDGSGQSTRWTGRNYEGGCLD